MCGLICFVIVVFVIVSVFVFVVDLWYLMVVEFYQSQGCLLCLLVDLVINVVVDCFDVFVFSFVVIYWDRFGWKDMFGDLVFIQC